MFATKYAPIKLIIVLFFISFAGAAARAGILDSGFLPTFNVPGRVNVMARQADGKIVVSGFFQLLTSSAVRALCG